MSQPPNQPPPVPPPPQVPYGQGPYPPGQYPQPGIQPLSYLSSRSPYGAAVACPRCGDPRSTKVSFTWWGGVLGPKLLSHVKCSGCGNCYNGKTGRPNTTGIILYSAIGALIGLLILFVFFLSHST